MSYESYQKSDSKTKSRTIPVRDNNKHIYCEKGFIPCGDALRVNLAVEEPDVQWYYSLNEKIKQEIRNWSHKYHKVIGSTPYVCQFEVQVAAHLKSMLLRKWNAVTHRTNGANLRLFTQIEPDMGAQWALECLPAACHQANLYVSVPCVNLFKFLRIDLIKTNKQYYRDKSSFNELFKDNYQRLLGVEQGLAMVNDKISKLMAMQQAQMTQEQAIKAYDIYLKDVNESLVKINLEKSNEFPESCQVFNELIQSSTGSVDKIKAMMIHDNWGGIIKEQIPILSQLKLSFYCNTL